MNSRLISYVLRQNSLVRLANAVASRLSVSTPLKVNPKSVDTSSTTTPAASALMILGSVILHVASSSEQVMGSGLKPSMSNEAGSSSKEMLTLRDTGLLSTFYSRLISNATS